jgi:hypothetical protein
MTPLGLIATYVGGPTAVLDVAGLRFITDPTFDPAGASYETPVYTLHKAGAPAITADALGDIDAVLLSHDHHFDNLDRAGRALLSRAQRVFVPPAGAERSARGGRALRPPDRDARRAERNERESRHARATSRRRRSRTGDRLPDFDASSSDAPSRSTCRATPW